MKFKKSQIIRNVYHRVHDGDIHCEINHSNEDNEWRWSICHQLLCKENSGVGIVISIGGECDSIEECEKKIKENIEKVVAWKKIVNKKV